MYLSLKYYTCLCFINIELLITQLWFVVIYNVYNVLWGRQWVSIQIPRLTLAPSPCSSTWWPWTSLTPGAWWASTRPTACVTSRPRPWAWLQTTAPSSPPTGRTWSMWSTLVSVRICQSPTSGWVCSPARCLSGVHPPPLPVSPGLCCLPGRRDVQELAGDIQRWRRTSQFPDTHLLLRWPGRPSRPLLVSKLQWLPTSLFVPLSLSISHLLPSICQAWEEHLARLHQQGFPSVGQTLWDVAGGPRVRHGSVVQPDLRAAPGPADPKLFQRVHRPLHRDPQKPLDPVPTLPQCPKPLHRGTHLSHRGTFWE